MAAKKVAKKAAKRTIRGTRGTPTPIVSDNPYEVIKDHLIKIYGRPLYTLTMPGEPRGFNVSRAHNKSSRVAYDWARKMRDLLENYYEVDHLIATRDEPMFLYTEAWFGRGNHNDPENVAKLARDALFYKSPKGSGKDKHTAGAHAGPLYDKINPRTEVAIWRIVGAAEARKQTEIATAAVVHRDTSKRVKQRTPDTSMVKRVKNPFGVLGD